MKSQSSQNPAYVIADERQKADVLKGAGEVRHVFHKTEQLKGNCKAMNFQFPHCRGLSLLFCDRAEHELLLSQKAAEDVQLWYCCSVCRQSESCCQLTQASKQHGRDKHQAELQQSKNSAGKKFNSFSRIYSTLPIQLTRLSAQTMNHNVFGKLWVQNVQIWRFW